MNTQMNIQFTVPICFSISAASSGEALGMTPGSLKLVLNKVAMTKINKAPPTTGIAGVTWTAKYGQLKINKNDSIMYVYIHVHVQVCVHVQMYI